MNRRPDRITDERLAPHYDRGYKDGEIGLFKPPEGVSMDCRRAYVVGWRHADDEATKAKKSAKFAAVQGN
jgi:hypothetical protein